eukprot:g2193.t1
MSTRISSNPGAPLAASDGSSNNSNGSSSSGGGKANVGPRGSTLRRDALHRWKRRRHRLHQSHQKRLSQRRLWLRIFWTDNDRATARHDDASGEDGDGEVGGGADGSAAASATGPVVPWRVHHDSRFRRVWDGVTVLLLLELIVTMPLELAFSIDSAVMRGIDWLQAVWFIVDVLLNFVTTLPGTEGETVTRLPDIARAYAHSWFIVDLVSSIPL